MSRALRRGRRRVGPTGVSTGALVLRALVAVGPLVALLASGVGGPLPPAWLVVLVTATAGGAALLPETPLGAGALLAVVGWWGLGVDPAALPPTVVVAAAGLVVAHVAAVLVSYGPADLPVPRSLATLWVGRGAAALALAPPAWLLARVVEGAPVVTGIWVGGLLAASAAAVVAAASFAVGSDEDGLPRVGAGPAAADRAGRG